MMQRLRNYQIPQLRIQTRNIHLLSELFSLLDITVVLSLGLRTSFKNLESVCIYLHVRARVCVYVTNENTTHIQAGFAFGDNEKLNPNFHKQWSQ